MYIMSHLSTPISVGIMFFYSFLTFFLAPLLVSPFMADHPDKCVAGFLVGFTISMLLWMKYGRHFSVGGKYHKS